MKTQTKTIRRTAALLLVLLAALGMLAPLTALAAGADPVDATWSGKTATWKPPAKETSYYMLALYKDSSYLSDYSTTGTSYDFSDTIKNAGPGDYTYTVMAVFDDTSKSAIVSSDLLEYLGEGHPHPLDHVAAKDATCTENGVKEHYECSTCGNYYWDAAGEQQISDKNEVTVQALGHSWGEWQTTKAATATAEGEAKRVCQRDSSHVETKVLPKIAETTAATTKPAETTAPKATEETKAPVTQGTTPKTTTPAPTGGAGKSSSTGSSNSAVIWLIVAGVLLFVVVPAILIPVLVSSAKRRKAAEQAAAEAKKQEPVMNGSEYMPPYPNGQNPPYPNGQNPPYNGQYPNYPNGQNPPYNGQYPNYPNGQNPPYNGQYPNYPNGQNPPYNGQYPNYPNGQNPPYNGQYPNYPNGQNPPYQNRQNAPYQNPPTRRYPNGQNPPHQQPTRRYPDDPTRPYPDKNQTEDIDEYGDTDY